MLTNTAAYKGDEPYVFVSYFHKDLNAVFPEITRLKDPLSQVNAQWVK